MTLVDNTAQRPPASGDDCGGPPDKSDCGTTPLTKGSKATLDGYNRHFLVTDVSGIEFSRKGGGGAQVRCHSGEVSVFDDWYFTGGTHLKGELLLKMPRPSALRRRLVTVTRATHKHTASTDCDGGSACSDDVTRVVTLKLKRL